MQPVLLCKLFKRKKEGGISVADVLNDEFEDDAQKGKYMTFLCDGERYGLEIRYVQEIVGMQRITEVPEVAGYIKGLINLRGKVIPVVDMRLRFGKEFREYNDRTCIIVITVQSVVVGLIVDTIAEVVTIAEEDVLAPPGMGTNQESHFIYGVGKIGESVTLLISPEKLINEQLADELSEL